MASFKLLKRLSHNAASNITPAIHNPNIPNNANDAATMKKIKNSVDKWNCMV